MEKKKIERIQLEVNKLTKTVSVELPSNTSVKVWIDHVFEKAYINVIRSIISEKEVYNKTYVVFRYPSSWWQHLKKRLGLKYKTSRKVKTVKVRGCWGYPNYEKELGPAEFFILGRYVYE